MHYGKIEILLLVEIAMSIVTCSRKSVLISLWLTGNWLQCRVSARHVALAIACLSKNLTLPQIYTQTDGSSLWVFFGGLVWQNGLPGMF